MFQEKIELVVLQEYFSSEKGKVFPNLTKYLVQRIVPVEINIQGIIKWVINLYRVFRINRHKSNPGLIGNKRVFTEVLFVAKMGELLC